MFLIEILPSQVAPVRAFLDARKAPAGGAPQLLPVMRARVTGVRGRATNLDSFEDVRRQGLGREYTITYRDHLEANEKVVDGAFWTGQPSLPENAPLAEVSIEKGLHERSKINVGDTIRFDVVGRIIEARVSSVREVQWEDARSGGVVLLFRPGAPAPAARVEVGRR